MLCVVCCVLFLLFSSSLSLLQAQKALDRVRVDSVGPAPHAGKLNCLAIRSDRRQLLFCADTPDDYDAWLKILSSVAKKPE
jgi:hypothetical protein